jgi:hypothetical protein
MGFTQPKPTAQDFPKPPFTKPVPEPFPPFFGVVKPQKLHNLGARDNLCITIEEM